MRIISGPHISRMGWRELSIMLTDVSRVSDQPEMEPRAVFSHEKVRTMPAISPVPITRDAVFCSSAIEEDRSNQVVALRLDARSEAAKRTKDRGSIGKIDPN